MKNIFQKNNTVELTKEQLEAKKLRKKVRTIKVLTDVSEAIHDMGFLSSSCKIAEAFIKRSPYTFIYGLGIQFGSDISAKVVKSYADSLLKELDPEFKPDYRSLAELKKKIEDLEHVVEDDLEVEDFNDFDEDLDDEPETEEVNEDEDKSSTTSETPEAAI